jgi:uncharacterized protein (TIGR00369 family)
MSDPLLDRVLAADRDLITHLGIEVVEVGAGSVTLAGRPSPALVNSAGVVHGSYAFALIDTAAAYALAAGGIHAVTIGSHVTFSRPVPVQAEIRARARVEAAGRRLAHLRGEVIADGRTAVLATLQFMVVDSRV